MPSKLNFQIGDRVQVYRKITADDLLKFAALTGDMNTIHLVESGRPIVHGAFLNGLVSGVIGTKMPGSGTLVVAQNLTFPNKCFIDEQVLISVELIEVRKILKVKFECRVVSDNKIVLFGDAKLVMRK